MDEPHRHRPLLWTILGGFLVAVLGTAFAITGIAFGAYLLLRDADLGLDFDLGVDIGALEGPSAQWVSAFDVATGAQRWERDFGAGTEPIGMRGARLVLRTSAGFVAVDATTGAETWRYTVVPPVQEIIGLTDDAVMFIDLDGSLVAIDMATGAQRWRVAEPARFGKLLVTGRDVAVVVTSGGDVRAVDAATGTVRWATTVDVETAGVLSGVVVGDLVVVRAETAAVALDIGTGAVRWSWAAPVDQASGSTLSGYLDAPIDGGSVVGLQVFDPPRVGTPTTSTVFVDVGTGVERWRTASGALSSFSFGPDVAAGTLFENGEGGRLRARDPSTGAIRSEVWMVSGRVLAAGATVFVADGEVVAADAGTGARQWSRDLGPDRNATPVGVAGDVLVVAGD